MKEAKYVNNSKDIVSNENNPLSKFFLSEPEWLILKDLFENNLFTNKYTHLCSKETFLELTNIEELGLELCEEDFVFFRILNNDQQLYIAYDIEEDIYYFFI